MIRWDWGVVACIDATVAHLIASHDVGGIRSGEHAAPPPAALPALVT
jgi:hypothetical protein